MSSLVLVSRFFATLNFSKRLSRLSPCWFLIFTLFCGLLVWWFIKSSSADFQVASCEHSGSLDLFALSLLVGNVSHCFCAYRLFFHCLCAASDPLSLYTYCFFFCKFSLVLTVLVSLFSISASGEGRNLVNTGAVDLSSVVEGSFLAGTLPFHVA